MSIRVTLRPLLSAVALLAAIGSPSLARPAQLPSTTISANELLREAVANEKANANKAYMAWVDRVERPRGSITKLMVNTPEGLIARVVAFDDRPLSSAQRQQEDVRLERLLDPAVMHEKAGKQREDERRVERVLAALPDAFRCEYSGPQPQAATVRLDCLPNPKFSPPNYETQVLVGMKGEILIDRNERRLTRIAGTLFKDVTFGWGIFGRLKRGGHIEIEQSKVLPNHWSITLMAMHFHGKIMLLKSLHVDQTETCTNFEPVPEMNVAQALEFLRNAQTPAAANAN
jgi:hypothetical protein